MYPARRTAPRRITLTNPRPTLASMCCRVYMLLSVCEREREKERKGEMNERAR